METVVRSLCGEHIRVPTQLPCLPFYLPFILPASPLLFLFSSLCSHSSKWTPSMELWKAEEGTQFQAVLFPTDWTLHPLSFRKIQLKLSWSPEARSMVRPPRLQGHMALPLNSALWAGACYLPSLSFALLPCKWGTNLFLTMLAVWHVFLARFPAQRMFKDYQCWWRWHDEHMLLNLPVYGSSPTSWP